MNNALRLWKHLELSETLLSITQGVLRDTKIERDISFYFLISCDSHEILKTI